MPFIVTLAMLISAQGLAERISGRRSQIVTDPTIAAIANTRLLGIPLLVYIFAAVVAVGWVVLNRTTFGRRTFAIGGNPEAARLAGLDVRRHTVALYVVSGLCCGIAAIMIASLTTTGSSTHGTLYELDAIAAVIIGGTLLSGGRGTLIGSILGVLVFTTITNLFVLNNLATEVQNIAKGAIIVVAVLIQSRRAPLLRSYHRLTLHRRRSSSMSEPLPLPDVRRRGLLIGALGLGAGAALTACTSNAPAAPAPTGQRGRAGPAGGNAESGPPVTIGFSAPAADHGWIAAIAKNAQAQAGQYPDVTFEAVNPTNDITQQIAAVETLINKKVNALVMLPNDGSQLTSTGRKAMDAGIPVINLDRIFDTPLAYRTWIGGDNYGMGVSAGTYIAEQLKAKGVTNPVIGEIAGIDSLPLTQERSKGFADALASYGFTVGPRQAADFTAQGGQRVAANLLQAAPKLDALWNHDDDQGIGVLAAIKQAGRSEFFMVGGAGSANAMRDIKADNTVLKATVTYSPTMASSAIALARLVAQNKGMGDLVEKEVPTSITLASATITKENVDTYLPLGFES